MTTSTTKAPRVSGMDSNGEAGVVDVCVFLHSEDALDPALGTRLARRVLACIREGSARLDFSHVSVVSSAFANAFFLELAREMPLRELRGSVDFVSMRRPLKAVWQRSFAAVLEMTR